MAKNKRAQTRNQEKTSPTKTVTWADCEPTETKLQLMEKALIRFMITKHCGSKELNKSSRQCCEILPFVKILSPEWKGTTYKTFARDEHVQHQALYDVVAKLIEKAPTREAIEVERKDLRLLAAQNGEALPQYELLPEEREPQSEVGSAS